MHIKIISTIRNIILSFFTVIAICSIVFVFALFRGIEIDSIQIGKLEIQKLYLSFDKRLILKAQKVALSAIDDMGVEEKSFELDDLYELREIIENLLKYLDYFKEIYVENLLVDGRSYAILYVENIFYVDIPELNIATTFEINKNRITMDIKSLNFKDYGLSLSGNIDYNIISKEAKIDGFFFFKSDARIFFNANYFDNSGRLSIEGYSNEFGSIRFLERDFELKNPPLEKWLFQRVESSSLKIDSFSLDLNIKEPKYEDLYSLKARGYVNNPDVLFDSKLSKVKAKRVDLNFEDNVLYFDITEPIYRDKKLDGSKLEIIDVLGKYPHLNLDLKIDNRLDRDIQEILKRFNINLPLIQHSGSTKSALNLLVDLNSYDTLAKGKFESKNSDFTLANLDFKIEKSEIFLENNGTNHFVEIKNSKASLDDFLRVKLDGRVEIVEEIFSGNAFIYDFNISRGENSVVDINNIKSDFLIDFSKDFVTLEMKRFDIFATFDDENSFELKSLSKIYDHSEILKEHKIESGRAKITTQEFETFKIDATIGELSYPIITKDKKKLKNLKVDIEIEQNLTYIKAKNQEIVVYIDDESSVIFINNHDINISDQFLESIEGKEKESGKLYLSAIDTNIYFKDRFIASDFIDILIDGENLYGDIWHKNGKMHIDKNEKRVEINANNFGDEFVNRFFDKKMVRGGVFRAKAKMSGELTKGVIKIENSQIYNLNTLNNFFALIDTIPSLVVFRDPGFSQEGYEIIDGFIEFGYINDIFVIEKLYFNGKSVDIEGFGMIDLKNDSLDLDFQIHTVKNLSAIINTIPFVGYILFGDDGKVSSGVKVTGKIDDPKVQSKLIGETLQAPINFLERIIKTPFKLFGFDGNSSKDR